MQGYQIDLYETLVPRPGYHLTLFFNMVSRSIRNANEQSNSGVNQLRRAAATPRQKKELSLSNPLK